MSTTAHCIALRLKPLLRGCAPKYFALVPLLNSSNQGRIYKAYWDPTARPDNPSGGWKWRLIDVLGDGVKTILDDCGRVVSGSIGGTPLTPDAGAGAGATTSGPETRFYGFELQNVYQAPASCTGDASPCATCDIEENDFNIPNFYDYTTNSVVNDANLPMLPGSFHQDDVRDFSENKLQDQNPLWRYPENIVYSPLYNVVIFVYGSLTVTGNPDSLCYSNGPCAERKVFPTTCGRFRLLQWETSICKPIRISVRQTCLVTMLLVLLPVAI